MNVFDKIIGYSAEKEELKQICDILINREFYSNLGVNPPTGLFLYGEPGVGKTLMANTLCEATGFKVFICRKNETNGKFIDTIKNTFELASKETPSIVLLDDIDKFSETNIPRSNSEEYVTVQTCIDEYKNKNIFVIATANDIYTFPDSLIRAGRFDRKIEIKAPRGKDSEGIIKYFLANKKFVEDLDIKLVSRLLSGKSCAELESIINDAGIFAGYERSSYITNNHITKACICRMYDIPIFKILYKDNLNINLNYYNDSSSTVYHEASHVLVAEALAPESVTISSILHIDGEDDDEINRGFTNTYKPDKINMKYWINSRICILLAGKAGIEYKFGINDMGVESDLKDVNNILYDQINREGIYGFDTITQPYDDNSDNILALSEFIRINLEKDYYELVKNIISSNALLLEGIAKELAENIIIDMYDIKRIINKYGIIRFSIKN